MQQVHHNEERQRFEMETEGGLAVADYRQSGQTLTIYHTEVPFPLRGGGVGERLVCGTLEEVRKLGMKVVPRCWFVREIMGRHPEYRDLLAA
jgi:predicted GNAT family acetyltransferase